MSRCKSCDAPVRFVRNAETGRTQILDWPPRSMVVVRMVEGRAEECAVRSCTTDHHATCPDSKAWKEKAQREIFASEGGKEGKGE